jgi:arginase family enzyme
VDRQVTCLRGRTSDRTAGAGAGAEALARKLSPPALVVGEPAEPDVGDWSDDLPASRPVLEAAAAAVRRAFDAGAMPVLTASDCSICIATLPEVVLHEPDVHIAWIDAHGDFNTPATTESGFLGGMCLAAACGRWEADGWPGTVDPSRVHFLGVRDLDPGEEREVEAAGVSAEIPDGVPLYVHLDTDVLDPTVMAAQFPVPDGWDGRRLAAQLAELAAGCRIVGVEVTALEDLGAVELVAEAIGPLLDG